MFLTEQCSRGELTSLNCRDSVLCMYGKPTIHAYVLNITWSQRDVHDFCHFMGLGVYALVHVIVIRDCCVSSGATIVGTFHSHFPAPIVTKSKHVQTGSLFSMQPFWSSTAKHVVKFGKALAKESSILADDMFDSVARMGSDFSSNTMGLYRRRSFQRRVVC